MTALGDFSSGDVLTAADLNAIGTWETFTPDLKFNANVITPTTAYGRYTIINDIVIVNVGAATLSFTGSGNLIFTLPAGAAMDFPENFPRLGTASVYDSSTDISYLVQPFMWSTSTTEVRFQTHGVAGLVTNASPFTFTSGADGFHATLIGIKA